MADRSRPAAQRGTACAMVLALMAAQVGEVRPANPWDSKPAVQVVLELRRQGIAAMTSGGASAASERYSSTFVANTPGSVVVTGEWRMAS